MQQSGLILKTNPPKERMMSPIPTPDHKNWAQANSMTASAVRVGTDPVQRSLVISQKTVTISSIQIQPNAGLSPWEKQHCFRPSRQIILRVRKRLNFIRSQNSRAGWSDCQLVEQVLNGMAIKRRRKVWNNESVRIKRELISLYPALLSELRTRGIANTRNLVLKSGNICIPELFGIQKPNLSKVAHRTRVYGLSIPAQAIAIRLR